MTDDEHILLSPLDKGEPFATEVEAKAADGMDRVSIWVPEGKGAVMAFWLERKLTETPELRQERVQEDALALLREAA